MAIQLVFSLDPMSITDNKIPIPMQEFQSSGKAQQIVRRQMTQMAYKLGAAWCRENMDADCCP